MQIQKIYLEILDTIGSNGTWSMILSLFLQNILYIGWIIAAFLAGLLLEKWPKKQKVKLQERFDRLNIRKGMSYVEILQHVQAAPRITDRNANGVTERTWVDEGYSIKLTFDRLDICLGMTDEQVKKV